MFLNLFFSDFVHESCSKVATSHIMYQQEYIIKDRREYRTSLYVALNVCGKSRAWNANINLRIRA